jgi:hypothetical protein
MRTQDSFVRVIFFHFAVVDLLDFDVREGRVVEEPAVCAGQCRSVYTLPFTYEAWAWTRAMFARGRQSGPEQC